MDLPCLAMGIPQTVTHGLCEGPRWVGLRSDSLWRWSVNGQGLGATCAAARATEVAGIAGGRLGFDFEGSSCRDHGGCDGGREL